MRVLGITGGIATGKSTVTQMFVDLGAASESADAIARNLLAPGTPETAAVAAQFPDCVDKPHVAIDRQRLAARIFSDPDARKQLEAILHPPIVAELQRRIASYRALPAPSIAVIEIPLLFEAGLTSIVDAIVVAASPVELQVPRLMERTGITEEEARRQIASQWPIEQKIAAATHVVRTDVPVEETREIVGQVWRTEVDRN